MCTSGKLRKTIAILITILLWISPATACTDVLLQSKEGFVHARSMDFHIPLLCIPVTIAPEQYFSSTGSDGSPGLSWKNYYAYAGMASKVMAPNDIVDGINDQGLSIGVLWLSSTQFPSTATGNNALASTRLISYLLGTCKNIQDVENALGNVNLWGERLKLLRHVPAVHLAIADQDGGYMVVEFINGTTNIYKNITRSLTNDPPLPSMLQYAKSSSKQTGSIRRFCMAADFSKTICTSNQEAIDKARKFFYKLHIPYKKNKTYTQWVIIKNLASKSFTIYENNVAVKTVQVTPKNPPQNYFKTFK